MQKVRFLAVACVLHFFVPQFSYCGDFEVTPVRINLDPKTPTAALTLRNHGSEPVVIQTETVKWSGRNVYTPTREVLVNPLIFTIKPGEAQIVRIAMTGSNYPGAELPYRIFFNEVPQALRPDSSGLQISLKIGIPVFLTPQEAHSNLQWSVIRNPSGKLKVKVSNLGNVHAQILDVTLSSSPGGSGQIAKKAIQEYVLPGQTTQWLIRPERLSPDHPWKGDTVYLTASTDHGVAGEKLKVKRK